MRFIIEGKIKGSKELQFIEKDFKDHDAAKEYAGSDHCKGWKKIKIKEV